MRLANYADIPSYVLNIPLTLTSGQAFRWSKSHDGVWFGAAGDTAIFLAPSAQGFWWQTHPEPYRWDVIQRYFQLDVPLERLYDEWIVAEPRIAPILERFAGLRILRQDPIEAVFTFLCACCNTMSKISRSVNALAERYGEPLYSCDGMRVCAFPKVSALAAASEDALRKDLWGFRAPRVIRLAEKIAAHGEGWVEELLRLPYPDSKVLLTGEFGIGEKIADCICLFALGVNNAVPVDTHIRKVVTELYLPEMASKSLTPKTYKRIAEEFQGRFGEYAGWAQQYFFLDATGRGQGGGSFNPKGDDPRRHFFS